MRRLMGESLPRLIRSWAENFDSNREECKERIRVMIREEYRKAIGSEANQKILGEALAKRVRPELLDGSPAKLPERNERSELNREEESPEIRLYRDTSERSREDANEKKKPEIDYNWNQNPTVEKTKFIDDMGQRRLLGTEVQHSTLHRRIPIAEVAGMIDAIQDAEVLGRPANLKVLNHDNNTISIEDTG